MNSFGFGMMDLLLSDLKDLYLPEDTNTFEKIKARLTTGNRVYWYYKEDAQYCKDEGLNPREQDYHSGIVVPAPDVECVVGGELEYNECVIVRDRYPCEKEYPCCDWMSIGRLLNNPDLVEIYDRSQ